MQADSTVPVVPMHRTTRRPPCARCGGLMLPENLYDQVLGFGPMECWGWRCITCGEIVDPLILQHRREQTASRREAGEVA